MAKAKKPKYYAVKKGRKKGIYRTWDECKNQTHGYKGAIFKSFPTMAEAQVFIGIGGSAVAAAVAAADTTAQRTSTRDSSSNQSKVNTANVVKSIQSNSQKVATSNMKVPANEALSIEMYFDGGSRGNPGLGGSGAYIIVNNRIPHISIASSRKIRHFCGQCTNNIAEYTGLVEGLRQVDDIIQSFCTDLQNSKKEHKCVEQNVVVKVFGDSKLIINQMNGDYAVKNEELKKKYKECADIIDRIRLQLDSCPYLNLLLSFDHVYRSKNTVADCLANEAMDTKQSWISEEDKV